MEGENGETAEGFFPQSEAPELDGRDQDGELLAEVAPARGPSPPVPEETEISTTPPSPPSAATVADEDGFVARLELIERSYKEVLDATKHQDDKVGRFLTAIAFLTTGAIALIATDTGLKRQFALMSNGTIWPLLALAAGLFFFFVIASVALLLLCLSVPVRLPSRSRSLDRTVKTADSMAGSRIFYSYIAVEPLDEWTRRWKSKAVVEIREEMVGQYVRETHNLAERATAKYRHTFEASALFVLALLFLGVAIFLKIVGSLETDPVPIGRKELLLLAVFSASHAALQIYTRVVHDRRSVQLARNYDQAKGLPPDELVSAENWRMLADKQRYEQRRGSLAMLVAAPVYSFSVAITTDRDAVWTRVACIVLASISMAVALWLSRPRVGYPQFAWNSPRTSWHGFVLLMGVASYVFATLAVCVGGLVQLAAVLAPPVALAAAAATRPSLAQRSSSRTARKRNLPVPTLR